MNSNTQKLIQLEFLSICLVAFTLPLFESPRHIFCLIYLCLFSYRILKEKTSLPRSNFGIYIILFIAGNIIASLGAIYNGYEIKKLHDVIRYSLIGLMILYTPLSKRQLTIICLTLVTSTFLSITEGYYFFIQGARKTFELKSVGHINHSSIYILLTLGITLPLFIKYIHCKKRWAILFITNIALTFFLFQTRSRATIIGLGIILFIFIIIIFILYKKSFYVIFTTCLISTGLIILNPPNVIEKFIDKHNYFQGKNTPREKLWNTAFHAWKKEPLFGVGHGNYSAITPEKMKQWYKNSNIDTTDSKKFMYLPHSHNRFMNTLAESGVIGLLSLIILLGGAAYLLLKHRMDAFSNQEVTFYWVTGANTLAIISLVGLFNTTLHHEHGLLSMILLGISFNYLEKNKNLSSNKPAKIEGAS